MKEQQSMKISEQSTDDLTQLAELIENISVAMLTLQGEGGLTSRPMAPLEMDTEGNIWFLADQRSIAAESIRTVNLSFVDTDTSTYVSISGRCELLFDRAQITRLWTEFARPWFPEGADSSYIALLKFVPEAAEYWDSPHNKMVRMFAMAASIVTGKPMGLGVHDTLADFSDNKPGGFH
jgi:general stress protein 26